jgi:hypothetical protein
MQGVIMPEQKKNDKKLSLAPLDFEEALKGLLALNPRQKRRRTNQQRNGVHEIRARRRRKTKTKDRQLTFHASCLFHSCEKWLIHSNSA